MAHTKIHQILQDENKLDAKNYSHLVSIRRGRENSWLDKGYEVVKENHDSLLMGKKRIKEEGVV